MNSERRNDVGLKITYVILTAIISIMVTIFLMKTYTMAEANQERSYANEKGVAVLVATTTQGFKNLEEKMDELIKLNK